MNKSDLRECRELIAKLSDGTLTPQESLQLNELLKGDDIAQQAYLDHMFIDGLLEQVYNRPTPGMSLAARPATLAKILPHKYLHAHRRRTWRNAASIFKPYLPVTASLACLSVFAFVYCAGWFASSQSNQMQVPLNLADSGFEARTHHSMVMAPDGGWFGDHIKNVERHSGVDPLEGERMLHWDQEEFPKSQERSVYQLVDLREEYLPDLEESPAVVASANFNTAIELNDQTVVEHNDDLQLYGVSIYAYAEKPVRVPGVGPTGWGHLLATADCQLAADLDQQSWQNVTAELNLPPETLYLVIELSVVEPASELEDAPSDHFVDKVTLGLVSSL